MSLELLTFSCGYFVRKIIAALSSKQCVCLVISKVRSKELLDTILPLSKTLWRIRDKYLKSLTSSSSLKCQALPLK